MDEKRIARLFFWINVRWTIRGQSDPKRDNYLSGMIPSAWDADTRLRLMQRSTWDGGHTPATIPAEKAPEEAR
jgi:hypothetical protein